MSGAAGVPGVLIAVGRERRGVLLRGPAGSGKSALALTLIERGHALVADDMALLRPDPHSAALIGSGDPDCAEFLYTRDLGVVNVVRLFGADALAARCTLSLVADLDVTPRAAAADPLRGRWRQTRLLGRTLPLLELESSAARAGDRALWVECALRELALRADGYDARDDLIERQRRRLDTDPARCA